MSKSETICISSVNLSSVKRYTRMATEDRSLAPKKKPSKAKDGRTRRLLEEERKERLFVTLQEEVSLCTALC